MYFVEETFKTIHGDIHSEFRHITDKQYYKEYRRLLKKGFNQDRFTDNALFSVSNAGLRLIQFVYEGQ